MADQLILAIDQGTTGSTAMLYDIKEKVILGTHNIEFPQHYPKPGWVEHDLTDIWNSVRSSIKEVLKKTSKSAKHIKAIGITNQRETTCAFDNKGEPLSKAIVWQDRRTSNYCELNRKEYQNLKNLTGLPLDPYFSATKMNWLLVNNQDVQRAYHQKNLKFGTIDTFILYKLTHGESYFTEPSNASRTLLFNIEKGKWDKQLLNFFEISEENLPIVKSTFDNFGLTKGLDILPDGIPITCLFGDQQSALFGQAGINSGDLKCTYGTGAFLLLNTGKELKYSQNGLLSTIAYSYKGRLRYALEGSTYIAGAAVQFLRDNLQFIRDASEVESLASDANYTQLEYLYFFPFFTGIGSPYWNAEAKACIYGMTRDTGKAQIARACLEGITLSINDLVEAMEKDRGSPIESIKVDGGAVKNNLLMQSQSNFSGKEIIRPEVIETTAFGAILGSLVGLGLCKIGEIGEFWKQDHQFTPSFSSEEVEAYYKNKAKGWKTLCQKLF